MALSHAVLVAILSGLAAGSQLFLVAAGLTLIVGISRVANLSLGALAILGAVVARTVMAQLSPDPAFIVIGILAAAVATAATAALLDILILRRLRHAPDPSQRPAMRPPRAAKALTLTEEVAGLISEHDTAIVSFYADRVLLMDRGTLIADTDPAGLRADNQLTSAYVGEAA